MKFKLVEENELKKRNKWAKKRQKGMSPFTRMNAGNVEKGIEIFNNSIGDSTGDGCSMGESLDNKSIFDSIKKISIITLVDDVKNEPFTNYNINESYSEEMLLNMTDDELIKLSDEDINLITNIEILDKLNRLIPDKLSHHQKELLYNEYITYSVKLDSDDIQNILEKIKSCNYVQIVARPKNNNFIDKYDITPDDAKNILNRLTVDDYVDNRKSFSLKHLGNNLIIFNPDHITIKDSQINNIKIYIKIDLDESTNTTAVMVSIHE